MSAVTATVEKAIDIQRRQVFGDDVSVLADIYNEDVNLAVWRSSRNESTASAAGWIVQNKPHLQLSEVVNVQSAFDVVCARLNGGTKVEPLCHDIAQMVDMFCCLFDLRQVGLRLSTLDKAMCSRFHADRVPARLVTTFCGAATQWLSDDHVDRSKLGVLSKGLADADSGLYANPDHVQALQSGDVALLKGELWRGNAGSGLVHRSPAMPDGSRRLLMTLDFFDD